MNAVGDRNAIRQIDIAGPMWVSEGVYLLPSAMGRAHRFGWVEQMHRPHLLARGNRTGRRIRHPRQPAWLAHKFSS